MGTDGRKFIGISGSYGGMNLDDEAILEGILGELRAAVPAEVTVFSMESVRHARPAPGGGRIGVRSLTRKEIAPAIKELDLLVLGGGGILFDGEAETYLREVLLAAVDSALDELAKALEPGDVVADGGNSYWDDSIRRRARLRERGIQFVDLGTSGGLEGARHGACFMAGGERPAVARLEPLLCSGRSRSKAATCMPPPGAGHFVKLVHHGIEFGMLQAIAPIPASSGLRRGSKTPGK